MLDEATIRRVARITLSVLVACWLTPTEAARWNSNGSVGFGLSYTDTASEQPDKQGGSSTTARVNPSLSLQRRSSKSDIFLSSELEMLKSLDDGDYALYPALFGSLRTELFRSVLGLNSSIFINTVEVAEDDSAVGVSNFSGNVSNTLSFTVNPTVDLAIGNGWFLRGGYAFNVYQADDNALSDSHSNRIGVTVEKDSWDKGYALGAEVSSEHSDISGSDPFVQRQISVFAGVGISRTFRLLASAGREDNSLPQTFSGAEQAADSVSMKADMWDVGLTWRPGARTSLEIGYGESFFGKRPRMEIEYRNRRSSYAVSWSRQLVRTRQQLPETYQIDAPDQTDEELIFQPVNTEPFGDVLTLESTSLTVDEEIQIQYILRGRVSRLRLETRYSKRETSLDAGSTQSSDIGLFAGFERNLSGVTLLTVSYDHRRNLGGSHYNDSTISCSIVFTMR